MRVLVIGSGGREHALCWRLARCPSVRALYACPGNPGMAAVATCLEAGEGRPEDFLRVAERVQADLTVVGPEAPLVAGVADCFRAAGRLIVAPSRQAARLEGSKIFAKQFMQRAGIPTARFRIAASEAEALDALNHFGVPVVLKADGLAAGKGVVVARTRQQAEQAAADLLSGRLVGPAGARLVVEECLEGEEASFIVLSDGRRVFAFECTQDHKPVGDGDTGPNTGGMGAYCDGRILSPAQRGEVLERIVLPAIRTMEVEGAPFTGFLYAGLMLTADGPRVLEFNVRMGDPEAQPLMHTLEGDLAETLASAARGALEENALRWNGQSSVCVVLASEGYPGTPRTGLPISGIERAEARGAVVFHAGTRRTDGELVTAGGRVLGVTASADHLPGAIERAYAAVREIHFEGLHYRRDIGRKGLKRW
ncbi:MAG: phosphoribosylamine--glycine ligase [Bryobacteraceae bacterium]|nr:phosphoribosylamine--glycine ligase [Bryobacteraceae bacterium]